MDQEPLVSEQIEAGSRFLKEFEKYAPIKSAAWLRESDTGMWYLYIVSDKVIDSNVDVAYGEVLRIVSTLGKPRIDPFRIRLIAANTEAANRVIEIQHRHATGTTPEPRQQLGSLGVEGAHVYDVPIGAGG